MSDASSTVPVTEKEESKSLGEPGDVSGPRTVQGPMRALEAIDLIVSDDFCEELDMANAHRKLRGRIATAREKLSMIYMIAHSEVPTHICHHVHDDWRKIKDAVLSRDP